MLTFTLVGFFVVPMIIKSVLTKKLSENLQRKVLVQRVRFNPYTLTLRVNGLAIKDRDDEIFVFLDEFFVNLQSSSLLKKALVTKGLHISRPYIRIVRNGDNTFNFSDLMAKKGNNSTSLWFSLHDIKVIEGEIQFQDSMQGMQHTLTDINVAVPFLSNLPEYIRSETILNFSALLNDSPVFITGKSLLFGGTRRALLHVDVQRLTIPRYSPYLPFNTRVNVHSGCLDMRTMLSYSQNTRYPSSPSFIFFQTFLTLDSLIMKHKAENDEFLALPRLSINNSDINVTKRVMSIGKILIDGGFLRLKRFTNGAFNFQDIIPPAKEPKSSEEPKKPWQWRIKNLRIKEFAIQGEDCTVSNPVHVTLDHINLRANNLSMKNGEKGYVSLSLRYNQGGQMTAKGSVLLIPAKANIKVSAHEIDLSPLSPYFTNTINLIITGGNFHANGRFTLAPSDKNESAMRYRGEASLTDFVSTDRASQHNFLTWETFLLSDMDLHYNPINIDITKALLNNFSLNVLIRSDGTPNIETIVAKTEDVEKNGKQIPKRRGETPESHRQLIPPTKIKMIHLQNGEIIFLDRYIKPNFESKFKDIRVIISNLSTVKAKPSDILLTGKLEDIFPVEITGEVNPFSKAKYADINVVVDGLGLPSFTPYSTKYLGYTIEKGKLYLNLAYKVHGNQLTGENQITLDQFILGDKVDSPAAISLPIKFAVGFLKNREGKIKLEVPVSGDLSNPEFKLGKVILNSMTNLVKKIVTTPFAFLGSIFGDGKELDFLEFEYGSDRIDKQDTKKLEDLITALYERPSLRLEIEGEADQQDRKALQLYQFMNILKAQKLRDIVKKGKPAVPLDQIEIHDDEYNTYLKKAYRDAGFPGQRRMFILGKKIPIQEMEKRLMSRIKITDRDLRLLADERANHVRDYLLSSKKIEPDRIFIVKSKIYPHGDNKKIKHSRVQFALL